MWFRRFPWIGAGLSETAVQHAVTFYQDCWGPQLCWNTPLVPSSSTISSSHSESLTKGTGSLNLFLPVYLRQAERLQMLHKTTEPSISSLPDSGTLVRPTSIHFPSPSEDLHRIHHDYLGCPLGSAAKRHHGIGDGSTKAPVQGLLPLRFPDIHGHC